MTEPTPEQELRDVADNLEGWEPLDEVLLHSGLTVADLRTVLDALDTARATIEAAPHADQCASIFGTYPPPACDCWKANA